MTQRSISVRGSVGWLAVVVVIGLLVRLSPAIGAGFPVGDGGLFASMIGDIRAAGFALPAYTSYNGGDIPFAYPPLALYLGALLPLAPLTTLQWLPPLLATACIVPIHRIGTRIGPLSVGLAAATFYAVAPFGWYWLVQGGGLTRALAMLLGLSAIALALDRRAIGVGILGGLTALTHPETAVFAAITVAAIGTTRRDWRGLVVAAVVSVVVVAPWVAVVVATHGLDPFVAAAGARNVNPIAAVLSIDGGRPGILDLAAAVGLVGLAASGIGWLIAAAAATTLLLTTSLPTHLAPLMALGVGATVGRRAVPVPVVVAVGVLLLVGAGVTVGNPAPLGTDDRAAMAWIAQETPPEARFVVLSDEIWSEADEAEWFPHLTGRVSVLTMQGREWLPDWQALDRERHELLACEDRGCVDAWMADHDAQYVYLADNCCAHLAAAMADAAVLREGSATLYAP